MSRFYIATIVIQFIPYFSRGVVADSTEEPYSADSAILLYFSDLLRHSTVF